MINKAALEDRYKRIDHILAVNQQHKPLATPDRLLPPVKTMEC